MVRKGRGAGKQVLGGDGRLGRLIDAVGDRLEGVESVRLPRPSGAYAFFSMIGTISMAGVTVSPDGSVVLGLALTLVFAFAFVVSLVVYLRRSAQRGW